MPDIISLRDRTAIVGVGRTKADRNPDSDSLLHLGRALKAAVEDAGLARDDIDGILVNHVPDEGAMDKLPEMLGLKSITWAFQSWNHGRQQPSLIAVAAMAVSSGLAKRVACLSNGQFFAAQRAHAGIQTGMNPVASEMFREGGGPHLESPAYGLVSIGGGAAMAMRRYLSNYGGAGEKLGAVAVAQRAWAQYNPDAFFCGRPITIDDYRQSPYVVEPLRVLDHCVPGNSAFCLIVTTSEQARDCPKPPVYISGVQGSVSGRERFVFGRTGLGVGQQTEAPYKAPEMPVYRMADVGSNDIQILGCLDAFSPLVPFTLEEFGFCGEGEALDWIQGGRTAPGGEFPINTCGGGLSDVESFGWGHSVDLVRQLRGEAGDAQVPGVRVCQYASLDGSSMILTRR